MNLLEALAAYSQALLDRSNDETLRAAEAAIAEALQPAPAPAPAPIFL